MPRNTTECLGMDCPYVQLGETTVWHDDRRFKKCAEAAEDDTISEVFNPRREHVCAYAASIIINSWNRS